MDYIYQAMLMIIGGFVMSMVSGMTQSPMIFTYLFATVTFIGIILLCLSLVDFD